MYNSVEGSENSSKSRMTQLKPVKDWMEKLGVWLIRWFGEYDILWLLMSLNDL